MAYIFLFLAESEFSRNYFRHRCQLNYVDNGKCEAKTEPQSPSSQTRGLGTRRFAERNGYRGCEEPLVFPEKYTFQVHTHADHTLDAVCLVRQP